MSIYIRNTIHYGRIKHDILLIRKILGVEKFDIGIMCVDEKTMRILNKRYRNIDQCTDILSFSFFENLIPGQLPKPQFEDEYNLGDIFLQPGIMEERSKEVNSTISEMITLLLAHGYCHLLGYDHSTKEQYRLMYDKELHILNEYSKLTGIYLKPITQQGH